MQNELGRAIAERVRANLTPQRQIELATKHVVNPEAYDLYLKGRFYWNQRTPDSIKEEHWIFSASYRQRRQLRPGLCRPGRRLQHQQYHRAGLSEG